MQVKNKSYHKSFIQEKQQQFLGSALQFSN